MVCGLCAFSCHFCLHEQVDGTVSFSSFNCFSSLEALQGVHRAREEQGDQEEFLCEKYLGSELSKSLRCKECTEFEV
jgi:hypothetical protein